MRKNKITIIAEIGQNHNGDMRLAKELIREAKANGADIAKFQLFDTDYIFKPDFKWYKEAKQAELTKEQVKELHKECQKVGIEFLASVFDVERVKWTEEIGMRRYKIASRSIYDKELIKAIEKTKKPIIASLGMWKEPEFPKIQGKVDYLFCVSKYPTLDEDLTGFPEKFDRYSGFSDHTIGIKWAIEAMKRGAKIIEKHFTLDKNMHGPDHKCSIEPHELKELVKYARRFGKILCH